MTVNDKLVQALQSGNNLFHNRLLTSELNSTTCNQFPYIVLSALQLLHKHGGEGTSGCIIWTFTDVCTYK
jgi:hypothetical protein